VSADKVEPDEDAEVDVQVLDTYRVEDLSLGASDVDLVGQVLDTDSIRTFDRDDGSEGRVANLTVGDETGRVRVTLWDDKADLAEEFEAGEVVEVGDGYVRERDGDLELPRRRPRHRRARRRGRRVRPGDHGHRRTGDRRDRRHRRGRHRDGSEAHVRPRRRLGRAGPERPHQGRHRRDPRRAVGRQGRP